jgi:hypothetical protein
MLKGQTHACIKVSAYRESGVGDTIYSTSRVSKVSIGKGQIAIDWIREVEFRSPECKEEIPWRLLWVKNSR